MLSQDLRPIKACATDAAGRDTRHKTAVALQLWDRVGKCPVKPEGHLPDISLPEETLLAAEEIFLVIQEIPTRGNKLFPCRTGAALRPAAMRQGRPHRVHSDVVVVEAPSIEAPFIHARRPYHHNTTSGRMGVSSDLVTGVANVATAP